MGEIQKYKHILNTKMTILVVFIALFAVLMAGYVMLQQNKITSLDKKISSLNDTNGIITVKSSKLSNENANMKKALQVLQKQITTTDKSSSSNDPLAENTGFDLLVNSVGHQSITVPANDYHGPLSTDYFAINVTVTNKSKNNQTYDTGNFSATTSEGLIVRPPSFGPGIDQTVWTRSELAPGGNMTVTLLFPITQKLVTLTLIEPTTKNPVTVPLPVVAS